MADRDFAGWTDARGREIRRLSVPVVRQRSLRGGLRQSGEWGFEALARRVERGQCNACASCSLQRVSGMDQCPGWKRVDGPWSPVAPPGLPFVRVGGRPSTPTGSGVGAARFTFAVNTPKFYEAPKYGPPDVIARDLRQLGARVARHPGRLQLFFDQLVASCSGEGCTLTAADLTEDAFYTAARSSEAFISLGSLARTLRDTGEDVQLIVTLFHLGAGAPPRWGTDGLPAEPAFAPYSRPLELRWAAELADATIVDGLTGENHPFRVSGASDDWNFSTIDPRNPFKREVYRRMGVGIGRALAEVADDIAEYLAGIEIFNEIETYHVVEESDGKIHADGRGWAEAYYYVAAGLLSECDWLSLWIPGIASYQDDADLFARTYDGKVEFLDRFLDKLNLLRADIPLGFTMDQLVAGVDYHYYHRSSTDAQSLLYLPLEVQELRALLRDYVQDGALTVVESGVNVVCSSTDPVPTTAWDAGCEASGAWEPYPDYTPPGSATADYRSAWYGCPAGVPDLRYSRAPADAFQAVSLWKRLVAAMLGGADIIGWHTHLSDNGSAFAGTGLRRDFHADDLEASIAAARPSWFAFQRLVRVLGRVSEVTLLNPAALDLPTRGDLGAKLGDGSLDGPDLVWVVEFAGARMISGVGSGGTFPLSGGFADWWAYAVFIDDTAVAARTLPACASVRFVGKEDPLTARPVYFLPTTPTASTLMSSSGDEFPSQTWSVDPTVLLPHTDIDLGILGLTVPTWRVQVSRGQWPALLLCRQRLAVGEIEVS